MHEGGRGPDETRWRRPRASIRPNWPHNGPKVADSCACIAGRVRQRAGNSVFGIARLSGLPALLHTWMLALSRALEKNLVLS